MMIFLDESLAGLLREVLHRRAPELDIEQTDDQFQLSQEQRQQVCELLGQELCASGLRDNDEPNARGLLIERLIDKLKPWQE